MRAVYNVITAKPGAVVWCECELARAVGATTDEDVTEVTDAVSTLFLEGMIVPAYFCDGWRRA